MLKYKILIKLFQVSCELILCVYGDNIQVEVVVLLPLQFALYCTVLHCTVLYCTAQTADTILKACTNSGE